MNMNLSGITHSLLFAALLSLVAPPLFAQTPPPTVSDLAKPSVPRLFDFPGGTPADFLSAVDKTFGVDWSQIAAIPEKARRLRIPAMRMRVARAQEVFNVANKLTGGTPNLGAWNIIPGDGTVSAVVYEVGRWSTPSAQEVRAIPLRDVPPEKWDELLRLLDENLAQLVPPAPTIAEADPPPVNVRIHRASGMLMITANKQNIERVEALAVALRSGMIQVPRGDPSPEHLAASKLVAIPPRAHAKALEDILAKASTEWTSAQRELGARANPRTRFAYLGDLHGVLLVGPREWIGFAEQVTAEWAARQLDSGAAALAEGLKARAFSVAGLSAETVQRIVGEVEANSQKLRSMQQEFADRTGGASGRGVFIHGRPEAVEGLQVVLVTGNDAGLEFARTFIEEAKAGVERSANAAKYVTVGGAVRSPSRMLWTQDLTVLGAISASGGLTQFAKDNVRLTRGAETLTLSRKQMVKDPKSDLNLQPGDRLEVDE